MRNSCNIPYIHNMSSVSIILILSHLAYNLKIFELTELSFFYSTILYCTVLYCTVLYCTVLYCTVLYCTAGLGHPVYSGWLNLDVNRQSFHCFLVPAVYLGSYLFDLEWRKFLQGSIQYLNNMHRLYIYWVPLISIVLKTVLSQ